jgi:hypothetical protein
MRPAVIVAAALLSACGATTEYLYAPRAATTWIDGYPATRERIPPEEPHGAVEAVSFGVISLDAGGRDVLALHARLVIENDDDIAAWQLDTRDQLLEIPGEGRSRAAFVNTDVSTLPILRIERRDRRVVDLYYPLPAGIDSNDDLGRFAVLWTVRTPDRDVGGRVMFDRVDADDYVDDETHVVLVSGWGPYWWYEPSYSRVVFVHPRRVIIREPAPRIIIRAHPTRHVRPRQRDHR